MREFSLQRRILNNNNDKRVGGMDSTQIIPEDEDNFDFGSPKSYYLEIRLPGKPIIYSEILSGNNDIGREASLVGIHLDHSTVSRVHAKIVSERGGLITIEDLGSSNKTWKNSAQLTPKVRYSLREDEVLKFGEVIVIFKEGSPPFTLENSKFPLLIPETPVVPTKRRPILFEEKNASFIPSSQSSPLRSIDESTSRIEDDSSFISPTQNNRTVGGSTSLNAPTQKLFVSNTDSLEEETQDLSELKDSLNESKSKEDMDWFVMPTQKVDSSSNETENEKIGENKEPSSTEDKELIKIKDDGKHADYDEIIESMEVQEAVPSSSFESKSFLTQKEEESDNEIEPVLLSTQALLGDEDLDSSFDVKSNSIHSADSYVEQVVNSDPAVEEVEEKLETSSLEENNSDNEEYRSHSVSPSSNADISVNISMDSEEESDASINNINADNVRETESSAVDSSLLDSDILVESSEGRNKTRTDSFSEIVWENKSKTIESNDLSPHKSTDQEEEKSYVPETQYDELQESEDDKSYTDEEFIKDSNKVALPFPVIKCDFLDKDTSNKQKVKANLKSDDKIEDTTGIELKNTLSFGMRNITSSLKLNNETKYDGIQGSKIIGLFNPTSVRHLSTDYEKLNKHQELESASGTKTNLKTVSSKNIDSEKNVVIERIDMAGQILENAKYSVEYGDKSDSESMIQASYEGEEKKNTDSGRETYLDLYLKKKKDFGSNSSKDEEITKPNKQINLGSKYDTIDKTERAVNESEFKTFTEVPYRINIGLKEKPGLVSMEIKNLYPDKKTDFKLGSITNVRINQKANVEEHEEKTDVLPDENTNIRPEENTNIEPQEMAAVGIKENINLESKEEINTEMEECANVELNKMTGAANEEITTNVEIKKYINTELEENTNSELEDDTNDELEDDTNVELEDDTNVELEDDTNVELTENTYVELEEDTNVELKEDTKVELEEDNTVELEDNTNVELGEGTNIELEENTNVELEENTNIEYEENTNVELKENTNVEYEEDTDLEYEEDTDVEYEEDTNIELQEGTNIELLENTNLELKENTTSELEENTNVELKGNICVELKENTKEELKTTVIVESEEKNNLKSGEKANIELEEKETIEFEGNTEVEFKEDTNAEPEEYTNSQLEENINIETKENIKAEYHRQTILEQKKGTNVESGRKLHADTITEDTSEGKDKSGVTNKVNYGMDKNTNKRIIEDEHSCRKYISNKAIVESLNISELTASEMVKLDELELQKGMMQEKKVPETLKYDAPTNIQSKESDAMILSGASTEDSGLLSKKSKDSILPLETSKNSEGGLDFASELLKAQLYSSKDFAWKNIELSTSKKKLESSKKHFVDAQSYDSQSSYLRDFGRLSKTDIEVEISSKDYKSSNPLLSTKESPSQKGPSSQYSLDKSNIDVILHKTNESLKEPAKLSSSSEISNTDVSSESCSIDKEDNNFLTDVENEGLSQSMLADSTDDTPKILTSSVLEEKTLSRDLLSEAPAISSEPRNAEKTQILQSDCNTAIVSKQPIEDNSLGTVREKRKTSLRSAKENEKDFRKSSTLEKKKEETKAKSGNRSEVKVCKPEKSCSLPPRQTRKRLRDSATKCSMDSQPTKKINIEAEIHPTKALRVSEPVQQPLRRSSRQSNINASTPKEVQMKEVQQSSKRQTRQSTKPSNQAFNLQKKGVEEKKESPSATVVKETSKAKAKEPLKKISAKPTKEISSPKLSIVLKKEVKNIKEEANESRRSPRCKRPSVRLSDIGSNTSAPENSKKKEPIKIEVLPQDLKVQLRSRNDKKRSLPPPSETSPSKCPRNENSLVIRPLRSSSRPKFKPVVMFTGYDEIQTDSNIVKELRGRLTDDMKDCTLLVMDKLRRTVKMLCMIAKGIPIVSPNYLTQSKEVKYFLDPWKYLIDDEEVQKQYSFTLRTSLRESGKKRLLTGYEVYVTKSVDPPSSQFKDIVKCSGGKFVKDLRERDSDEIIVISCAKDKSIYTKHIANGLRVFDKEFILTGILKHELDFQSYILKK